MKVPDSVGILVPDTIMKSFTRRSRESRRKILGYVGVSPYRKGKDFIKSFLNK